MKTMIESRWIVSAAALVVGCSSSSGGTTGMRPDGGTGGDSGQAGRDGGGAHDGGAAPDGGRGHDGGSKPEAGSTHPSDAGGGATDGGHSGPGAAIFQQPEPWTQDVSGDPADPRSAAILAALDALGGWGNGNVLQVDFSIPVFYADASTPMQTITAPAGGYCYGGPDCDPVPLQMPVPADGNIEGSTGFACDTSENDCHLLVVATNQNKLYELYNATSDGASFTALGAFVWDLTKAYPPNERGDQCTSADAAGFPIAGLLTTADEVASGAVNHALRFILPNERMAPNVYVHPASHAGGPDSTNANAPPYGVRFRLKSSFDPSSFNAGEKVVLKAMQTYGMLLSDGGNIALTFADDRTTTNKWTAQGIDAHSFTSVAVDDFEVVDLGATVTVTDNCVRNP